MTLSPGNPMRVVLLSVLIFEVIVFGLAIPVMILIGNVPGTAPWEEVAPAAAADVDISSFTGPQPRWCQSANP